MTPDPETTSLLNQILSIVLGVLLGGGGLKGFQVLQRSRAIRNGSYSNNLDTNLQTIITAVQRSADDAEEGKKEILVAIKDGVKEHRTVVRDNALAELRIELARKEKP
jgi:hypothetical protein